ncbi:hypothetical protein ACQ4PT_020717 [Festuca glaucescens]
MDAIEAHARDLGVNLSAVDLDSIALPPAKTSVSSGFRRVACDDEEICQKEDLPEPEVGLSNIVVVDNLPVVAPKKYEKLESVVRKLFSPYGAIVVFWMPTDPETQKTHGYCFIEYNTSQENLLKWLTDEKAIDQFVIWAGMFTEVYWNDAKRVMPQLVCQKQYWTDSYVQWSPLGTHLATVHNQGAQVWGGDDKFLRLMKFPHPKLKLIDFSPGERYLVTYSSEEPSNPRGTHTVVLNIFDVRTGKVMREFKGSADDLSTGGSIGVSGVPWPIFRWGGGRDDKYFARLGKNVVSVYETETFTLLDKKSLKVENVADFSWSPTDPIISMFVPEMGGGNQPAKVSLVQIPSRQELRQKNLFSVSDCKMYWQNNGEYLAVQVDRYTKTKKSIYTGFELYRIKEKDIPIEVFELDNKNDKIIAFAWEPRGHRFAIIHGDGPKHDISFYSVRTSDKASRVSKLTTIKGRQANALFWSPAGCFIVLAGLKGLNGQLEFYNLDDLFRFLATAVTSVHEMENGFQIWSFNGEKIYSYNVSKDQFYQFQWRPRPPSLLTPEKEKEISENLEMYSKKYKQEDRDVLDENFQHERTRRKQLREEWKRWVAKWKQQHDEERQCRMALRGGEDSDKEEEYQGKEVEVDEVVSVIEETLAFDLDQD